MYQDLGKISDITGNWNPSFFLLLIKAGFIIDSVKPEGSHTGGFACGSTRDRLAY